VRLYVDVKMAARPDSSRGCLTKRLQLPDAEALSCGCEQLKIGYDSPGLAGVASAGALLVGGPAYLLQGTMGGLLFGLAGATAVGGTALLSTVAQAVWIKTPLYEVLDAAAELVRQAAVSLREESAELVFENGATTFALSVSPGTWTAGLRGDPSIQSSDQDISRKTATDIATFFIRSSLNGHLHGQVKTPSENPRLVARAALYISDLRLTAVVTRGSAIKNGIRLEFVVSSQQMVDPDVAVSMTVAATTTKPRKAVLTSGLHPLQGPINPPKFLIRPAAFISISDQPVLTDELVRIARKTFEFFGEHAGKYDVLPCDDEKPDESGDIDQTQLEQAFRELVRQHSFLDPAKTHMGSAVTDSAFVFVGKPAGAAEPLAFMWSWGSRFSVLQGGKPANLRDLASLLSKSTQLSGTLTRVSAHQESPVQVNSDSAHQESPVHVKSVSVRLHIQAWPARFSRTQTQWSRTTLTSRRSLEFPRTRRRAVDALRTAAKISVRAAQTLPRSMTGISKMAISATPQGVAASLERGAKRAFEKTVDPDPTARPRIVSGQDWKHRVALLALVAPPCISAYYEVASQENALQEGCAKNASIHSRSRRMVADVDAKCSKVAKLLRLPYSNLCDKRDIYNTARIATSLLSVAGQMSRVPLVTNPAAWLSAVLDAGAWSLGSAAVASASGVLSSSAESRLWRLVGIPPTMTAKDFT